MHTVYCAHACTQLCERELLENVGDIKKTTEEEQNMLEGHRARCATAKSLQTSAQPLVKLISRSSANTVCLVRN